LIVVVVVVVSIDEDKCMKLWKKSKKAISALSQAKTIYEKIDLDINKQKINEKEIVVAKFCIFFIRSSCSGFPLIYDTELEVTNFCSNFIRSDCSQFLGMEFPQI